MKVKYTKTQWVNEETPLNSDNLNKIEDGIELEDTDYNSITLKNFSFDNIHFLKN